MPRSTFGRRMAQQSSRCEHVIARLNDASGIGRSNAPTTARSGGFGSSASKGKRKQKDQGTKRKQAGHKPTTRLKVGIASPIL